MSYLLLSGVVALVVGVISIVRVVLKTNRTDSGEYVTQTVLTRIKAEYRDAQ